MKGCVLAALAAATPAAAWAAATPSTMTVYVTAAQVEARKDVDDATKQALKGKRDAAKDARKAKEKELKAALGKKRDAWPPEKDDELYALEEAEALARADYEYRRLDPKGLKDSVNDIVKSFGDKGRKEHVALASSAAEADLVLEVLARRSEKELPTDLKASWCYVYFSLRQGGKLDAARFARVPAGYRIHKGFGWGIYKIASPSADMPGFRFETNNLRTNGAWGAFGCYGSAADAASAAVDKFAEDNMALLAN